MSNTHDDCIIVLIRHPESESNLHLNKHENDINDVSKQIQKIGDPDITETGKLQADVTISHLYNQYSKLSKYPNLQIYYSNCKRTHYIAHECFNHFVDTCKDHVNISKVQLPFLQEYTKPKKAKNGPHDFITDYTPQNFIGRVYDDFIVDELNKCRNGNQKLVFYFGHSVYWALVISMITLLNQEPKLTKQDIITRFINKETGRIDVVYEIPNCSITTIRYNSKLNKWLILGVGKNEHLGDHATGTHSVF